MPAGRPTELTPEVQAELVKLLEEGNYLETAAAFVGLDPFTIRRWIKRGEKYRRAMRRGRDVPAGYGEYVQFSVAVKKAVATAEADGLRTIRNAREWQAAAWRLERRAPKRWGKQERDEADEDAKGQKVTIRVRRIDRKKKSKE